MTYRPSDLPSRDCGSSPESRLNHHNKREGMAEGCQVIEECGTVCGETCNLSVFHEFRQIYDNCFKKLEKCYTDPYILKKLAPFKKLIEDLWEQNAMLVETVEELEEEATSRVTTLQDKLNKSCQKELHCTLKTKEREIEFLKKELEKKEELLKNYCCEIDTLKKDIKAKCKRNRDFVKQLKNASKNEINAPCEETEDDLDDAKRRRPNKEFEKIVTTVLKSVEDQRSAIINRFHSAECQLKAMVSERNLYLKERSEMTNQLKAAKAENEKLAKEAASIQISLVEKEEILKNIEKLKSEKKELMDKIVDLQNNLKELNNTFKETRWALTSEVAEKHDQVQELRKCVGTLEEQLRQADMQTHFKDDIIKELRKELKNCKKPASNSDISKKAVSREHSPPTQLITLSSIPQPKPKQQNEEVKLDIHIFPLNENDRRKSYRRVEIENPVEVSSVEIQTDSCQTVSPSKMRNVSTQHKTRVQKLPRSFGTLTVTPWSGTNEVSNPSTSLQCLQEAKKNLRGIFTVPCRQTE